MTSTPRSRARSTTRLEKESIDTLGRWATESAIISRRSSRVNSGSPFCGLRIGGDHDVVEELGGGLDDLQMPVVKRVE